MGRMRGPRAAAMAVLVAGAGAVTTLGATVAMPGRDLAELMLWAVGTAVLGGAAVAGALRLLRRRPLSWQLAALVVGATFVVAAGAWSGARAMFLSSHDLSALAVLLLSAGVVGCAGALFLGDRVASELEELVGAARRLGEGEVLPSPRPPAATEIAALARELEQTSARLDEARRREQLVEQSRRELVAWVSHDLRTPLAGILAIAEALEDGIAADDATEARYHATLRAEAEQLGGLIDDLFELSRAQAGVLRFELERLSLTDLVSDAMAGIAPMAASKGVRLEGRMQGRTAELRGSAPELLRAFRNILENAVRHTPADGSVVVESGLHGDRVFVSVLDDGGGVPPEALPRLFDVGYRADPARTPGGGAGLGLAIARSFVEAHRGRITVTNENGGARFTVWLPLDTDLRS